MTEKNKSFDANLVWVQEGEVSLGDLYIHSDHLDEFVPIEPDFLNFHTLKKLDPEHWRRYKQSDKIEERLITARYELAKLHGQKVVDLLEWGRLQLTFLLDTPGGVMDDLDRIARFIKSRKGRLSAFGSAYIYSAGAHLFMMAPKCRRFSLRFSNLMLHINSFASSSPSEVEFRKELEQDLREVLGERYKNEWDKIFELSEEDLVMVENDMKEMYEKMAESIKRYLDGETRQWPEECIELSEERDYLESLRGESGELKVEKLAEGIRALVEGDKGQESNSQKHPEEFGAMCFASRKKEIHQEREENEKEIRRLLLSNTIHRNREEMQCLLDQAFANTAGPDCPIYLDARQISHFGLARVLSAREMRMEFMKMTGVSEKNYRDTRIDHFFGRQWDYSLLSGMRLMDKGGVLI